MDPEALRRALENMDRRKAEEDVTSAAKSALDAAAAVGTDTPLIILRDIRALMIGIHKSIQENMELSLQRHTEIIATLQDMGRKGGELYTSYGYQTPRSSLGPQIDSAHKRTFYHWDSKVSTGSQVIAVILMQFDALIQNSGQVPNTGDNDVVVLDLKMWSSCVSKLAASESCQTPHRSKLDLPKPTHHETIAALEIVSSTEAGRCQPFRIPEAKRLQQSCISILGIVEEVRQRILKCPGLLPEGRRQRLAHLSFPYITKDDCLNVSATCHNYTKAGPFVLNSVPKLKEDAKKRYASEVLSKGTAPVMAYNSVSAT